MIARTVIGITIAVALLAVTVPVADSARVEHSNAAVERSVERFDRAVRTLAETSDPVPAGRSGARRYHTLSVPRKSWSSAALDRLVLVPPNSSARPFWRVTGGQRNPYRPPVPLVGPPGGLEIEAGGDHRLVLRLVSRDGRSVVRVSQADI